MEIKNADVIWLDIDGNTPVYDENVHKIEEQQSFSVGQDSAYALTMKSEGARCSDARHDGIACADAPSCGITSDGKQLGLRRIGDDSKNLGGSGSTSDEAAADPNDDDAVQDSGDACAALDSPQTVDGNPAATQIASDSDKGHLFCQQYSQFVPSFHYATHSDEYSSICQLCKDAKQRRDYAKSRDPLRHDAVSEYGHLHFDWCDTGPRLKTFGSFTQP
jgi:hypothetical protein